MTVRKRIAVADDESAALFKGIAMDIGKEVCAYIEVMYPQAVSASSSTFLLSVRNSICNEVVEAMKTTSRDDILARLERRKKERREWKAKWKLLRETDWEAYREKQRQATAPDC